MGIDTREYGVQFRGELVLPVQGGRQIAPLQVEFSTVFFPVVVRAVFFLKLLVVHFHDVIARI